MPRRRSGPRRDDGLPDSVDRIVAEWAAQLPGLPVAPVEVVARLARVRSHLDERMSGVFARHDLSAADFTVIAVLRRAGDPFTLPQSELMGRLGLTSGTVSLRLNRLESKGVVARTPSSTDSRSALVTLTARGVELFDRVAPQHLASEDMLLSALTAAERAQLAGLLRKLLVSFEHEESHSPAGFTVAPAHVARRARAAVGLSDHAGLLVQQVEDAGAADRAGLRPGDLIVGADGHPELRSCVDLAAISAAARSEGRALRLRVLRGERQREVELVIQSAPDAR